MKKKMKIGVVGFIIFVFFVGIAGLGWAAEKIKWKGQTTWPAGMPILQESAEYFAKRVKELSNGRLEIEMNAAGAIVPAFELIEAVNKGIVDVACGWAGYWRGKFPASPLFGAIEGGPDTMEYLAWIMVGGGLELWQEMYDQKNWQVKVLPPYSAHGPENLGWSNKPIRTLEDFKGLKFRTAGYYWGKVLTKMGASVVTLPGGEVIPALQRRVIDAAEWSMPCIDIKMGFHDVCKYLIIPGVHQPSSLDETLIYKKSWDSLPADLKAIVWTAARDSSLYIMTREMELNPPAMKFFKEKGIQIIRISPEVLRKAKSLADELFNETAATDPFFAKVLSSQRRFSKTWSEYAEMAKVSYK